MIQKEAMEWFWSLSKSQNDLENLLRLMNYRLTIPEKEMFGFPGANGAGKTTSFRMILGLLNPSSEDRLHGMERGLIIQQVR